MELVLFVGMVFVDGGGCKCVIIVELELLVDMFFVEGWV